MPWVTTPSEFSLVWGTDTKHEAYSLQGHLLVAPCCNSKYEGKEQDGAYDGPNNYVRTGDTWDKGAEQSHMCVIWLSFSCFLNHVETWGYTKHKTLQQNTKTEYT